MLICSKGQCVFHFPAFGKGNHVVVMDWVTITLVSEAGMIYLSAFQLSTEDEGEGELWRGLHGEKMRRVGEGDREKQDLYPDGNVETRVGATAGKERPQWRLFINSCSNTALKWKGLETIPSAPSLGCLGFQQGSSYILIAAQFWAQMITERHFFLSSIPCTSVRKYIQHLFHHQSLSKVDCSKSNSAMK